MKKLFFALCFTVAFLPQLSFPQGIGVSDSARAAVRSRINLINEKIKEKGYQWKADFTPQSYLSEEEMRKLCGVRADTSNLQNRLQKEDSIYQEYKALKKTGLLKTLTVPNWITWMGKIKDQGSCGNCWAHAAAGVTIGLLHNYYGSNIEIGLEEYDISDNASCGMGCWGTYYLDCGLSYIYSNKVKSDNYDHAYYTVSSYSNNTASIAAIKSSLQSSPVNVGMDVYTDFFYYTGGIYQHSWGDFEGGHAVVIVSYDDDNEC